MRDRGCDRYEPGGANGSRRLVPKEDFGIATIEAMKYGKPVIALKSGSAVELIDENISGIFFEDSIVESLCVAINKMEESYLHSNGSRIRDLGNQYSTLRFREEFSKLIK